MKKIFTMLCGALSFCSFAQTVDLQPFASGLSSPVEIVNAGDERLFVVQQGGSIRILNTDGSVRPGNFLSLSNTVVLSGGERGLLGLAFHPNYATNGFFYINYTRAGDGATVIARYHISTDPDVADPASATVLLTIPQPYSNHNGGTLRFGPDGYLYIGMGDGGSGGDPGNRAQDINENLGKMLRIDVDNGSPYGIPADNPYAGAVTGNDEIWAIGLRNPWKWSFDSQTGDMWIADVGQNEIEEINHFVPVPGLNFGWKCYEGNSVYASGCAQPGTTYTFPVVTYTHSEAGACSITGGYVYRGSMYPNFADTYFFADYCLNRIGMVDINTNEVTYSSNFSTGSFVSFGFDVNRELYVAGGSQIWKITDSSLAISTFESNGISMAPNPATESVTINLPDMTFPAQASFYDATGKRLMTQSLDNKSTVVDTNVLASGLYWVKIADRAGMVYSSKLTVE